MACLVSAFALHAQTRITFGGFGDGIFLYSSKSGSATFDTGELDLFVAARFSDRWSALAEGLAQHVRSTLDADVPPTKRVEADVERLYLSYDPSDRLKIELGQVHTGIIRWNEREHRSRFLQTPIAVPSIANREEQGGAWPLHSIGIWTSGALPGSLGIKYGAGAGEGRGTARDEIQPLADAGTRPAAIVSLSIAPDAIAGFEAGAAAYHGKIPTQEGEFGELDGTLFAELVRGGVELRSEWATMRHRRAGAVFRTTGWYALGSMRLYGRWQVLRPYVLIDHLDVAPGERYLSDVKNQSAWAAGVRWDVGKRLALKSELTSRLRADGARDHVIRAQVAFSF